MTDRAQRGRDGTAFSIGDPRQALLLASALGLSAFVIAYPFTLVRYPPLTDLPFHAALTSILRHYCDPAWHFRDQFALQLLTVPYLSMYVVGAVLALVMPIWAAAKVMAIVMLALIPAGMAVLFHGMKKNPLWGLSGLAFVWCTDTQWGFLNFMGATGLFMMSVGYALLVVDRPTRARRVGLAVVLLLLFFTHVYRFPYAVLGVLLAGAVVFPVTKRFSPLVWPLVPALALFVVWIAIRPKGMGISFSELGFHAERFSFIPRHLFGAYLPTEPAPPTPESVAERRIAKHMLVLGLFTMGAATVLALGDGRRRERSHAEIRWARGVTALALLLAAGFFVGYLTLPFQAGNWFYVYPREIVGAALALVAVAPDLPRSFGQRLAFVALLGACATPMTRFVSARFREFETATADFRAVMAAMPRSPKLFYLVYWLGDASNKRVSPFLHLPAWVQAEKGGALDFHFVDWNQSPVRYRAAGEWVPPPPPEHFEWEPQYFNVLTLGPWFDTFLVRHRIDPHELFDPDPSVHLLLHRGTWWLYRRSPVK
ncbi:MAG TPA: hypothetical protein VH142_01965 [Polyangiaceae bacterium]|jgi:hypothetical protein|nr:hypothetical protein [Polyangiaceae bacterium]